MNITQLAQKVAGLTLMVQNMISAAKRILELPTQETLVPASYIHVSNNGVSEKLEIQKIINAVANLNYNRLISIGTLSIVDNDLKIPAFAQWLINNIVVGNNAEVTIPIPFAEEGLNRTDLIYGNESGQILRLPGPELAGIFLKPTLPPNCVEITTLNVTDSTIGDPSNPVIGETFVKKENFGEVVLNSSGITSMVLQATVGGIRFQGSNTSFQSVFIVDEQNLWLGKPFKIKNDQPNSMTLEHQSGIGLKMSFPNAQNLIVSPKEIVEFEWHFNSSNVWELQYVGKLENVKRTHVVNCTITGTLTANTSWWTASRESGSFLSPVFEATSQYNPTTEVFLNARAAKHLIPFKSRIKRICWNYSTIATPLTINVHSFQGNSTIFNEKTVASKVFPTGSNNNTLEYTSGELNTSHVLEKNSYLTLCLFNNNVSTGLVRPNIFQIEIEEL